jgi:hypothetical protein
MTNWITDEWGNRTFTFQGWVVRIWEKSYAYRINVDAPHNGEEVEVNEEGIWVNGQSSGGWEGPGPKAFTIPWVVVAAITEAWAIVEKEKGGE